MKKKRKVWKIIGGVLLAIVLLLAAAVAYLTIREYRPDPIEDIAPGKGNARLNAGDAFTILTYNTGYAGLSKDEDFFMDGGSKVEPESKKLVEDNLKGITSILKKQEADIYFLQEVDRDSIILMNRPIMRKNLDLRGCLHVISNVTSSHIRCRRLAK